MTLTQLRIIFFGLLIVSAEPAHALLFSEETDYSPSQLYESVSGGGDFGAGESTSAPVKKVDAANDDDEDKDDPIEPDAPFGWSLGYSLQRVATSNQGSDDVIDTTSTVTLGLSWNDPSEFGLSGKLSFASTPEENLTSRGLKLTGNYRWVYGKADANYFTPYLNFRLLLGTTDYIATFSGQAPRRRGLLAPAKGTSRLLQYLTGVDLISRPARYWKFDFEFDRYFYNRDVAAFQNQLDSPAALQRGMAGFAQTVGGSPDSSYSLTVGFGTQWRIEGTAELTALAADQSLSETYKVLLRGDVTNWLQVSAGAERQVSNTVVDTLAILGFDCDF